MNKEEILNLSRGGLFESLRSCAGRIFRLDEHLDRLFASAKTLGMKIPRSRERLKSQLTRSLKKTQLKDAYLRIGLSREGRLDIIVKKLPVYPRKWYNEGVKVRTAPTRRPGANTLAPLSKSSDFLGGIFAKIETPQAQETLLLSAEGYVAEATVSNIFLIRRGILISPPVYPGVLSGITRKVVIELAGYLKIGFREEPVTRHDLYNAAEAFLTNTSMGIMPVAEIDGRRVGGPDDHRVGGPGKITRRLQSEFGKLTQRCC